MKSMKGIVSVIALALAVGAAACGGAGKVAADPFAEPDTALREVVAYLDRGDTDRMWATMAREHQARCPYDRFNALWEEQGGLGRVRVKSVDEVREVGAWEGFEDVTAVTYTYELAVGDEKTEVADTMHLARQGGLYRWVMTPPKLAACEGT